MMFEIPFPFGGRSWGSNRPIADQNKNLKAPRRMRSHSFRYLLASLPWLVPASLQPSSQLHLPRCGSLGAEPWVTALGWQVSTLRLAGPGEGSGAYPEQSETSVGNLPARNPVAPAEETPALQAFFPPHTNAIPAVPMASESSRFQADDGDSSVMGSVSVGCHSTTCLTCKEFWVVCILTIDTASLVQPRHQIKVQIQLTNRPGKKTRAAATRGWPSLNQWPSSSRLVDFSAHTLPTYRLPSATTDNKQTDTP
ncbi:hypothetical protein B0H66DRAFT_100114 [Apodospora peruviana]|uniref:Uncharacterized protein n=1 Tax=Apodospora peruviana TaxID=516989 RepID=A0AAE0HSD2_9PEZI|nr:hypothetical protein B0H66DRAFT_100114 [Apodospora peruviana]